MAVAKAPLNPDHLTWQGGTQPMKVGYGKLKYTIGKTNKNS